MDITLNRRGRVPPREQLAAQIELMILSGELAGGARLPSVRALAARLRLHANTISAAYRQLERAGQVTLRPGSGVFVRSGGGLTVETAEGLDEMIRAALATAFRKGHSLPEIKAAVERWLTAKPARRVVVADTSHAMAELLAFELRAALDVPIEAWSLEELAQEPGRLDGALAVTLPYHVERLRHLRPATPIQAVTLEPGSTHRRAIEEAPRGALVLVVSHSPTVLPFASKLIISLRGDDLLIDTRRLQDRSWRRVLPAADLVFADAVALREVRGAGARRVREVRVLSPAALQRVRRALAAALTPRTT